MDEVNTEKKFEEGAPQRDIMMEKRRVGGAVGVGTFLPFTSGEVDAYPPELTG